MPPPMKTRKAGNNCKATSTTLPKAQAAARAKGAERFEGFMQTLGRRLATGDRFLKELSRDLDSLPDDPLPDESEGNGDQE